MTLPISRTARGALLIGLLAGQLGCASAPPPVRVQRAQDWGGVGNVVATMAADVRVTALEDDQSGDLDALAGKASEAANQGTARGLTARGFLPGERIDWNGAPGIDARAAADLHDTFMAVASDAAAGLKVVGRRMIEPGVLLPLLERGHESTLFVAGSGHVGRKPRSHAGEVAAGVVLGLLVIGVIALAVAGGKGGGGGGAGHLATGAARGAVEAAGVAARTAIEVAANAPPEVWAQIACDAERRPPAERDAQHSNLDLAMILVSNRDGRVLWAARQTSHTRATNGKAVARRAEEMLRKLPRP